MKKVRIGKTINFKWSVLTDGQATSLSGRTLKVVLTDCNNKFRIEPSFTTTSNVISFKFEGKDQKFLGDYNITLYENYGLANQNVLDCRKAVTLVSATDEEE